jgi:hypothetical protein
MQRYAGRPILRPLVHRGGLRADILDDGEIGVGDRVRVIWSVDAKLYTCGLSAAINATRRG